MLFLALLMEINEQVSKSHGDKSSFGRMVHTTIRAMMGPGGQLDATYGEKGLSRDQWQEILREQITDLWPKIKAFVEDDDLAAEIDEAVAE